MSKETTDEHGQRRGRPRCSERDAAIADGLLTYFTGRQCNAGHISPRYVRGYACKACACRVYDD